MARDDYRRLEQKYYRIYQVELLVVALFSVIMVILLSIPFPNFYMNWVHGILDMLLLMFNAIVLRSALSHNTTFFDKLYHNYRYEYHRHIKREGAQ